jgi:adenylylsulfate reductase subunit B
LLTADAQGKTEIRKPQDCWGCTSCLKECHFKAIRYFLGADIGGSGSFLYTRQEGNLLHWIIVAANGTEHIITIDKNQANAY